MNYNKQKHQSVKKAWWKQQHKQKQKKNPKALIP